MLGSHFFRREISEQQVPPNFTVVDPETNQRYFMLLRPQEESTEIETYLNPLFTAHSDIFLQPVNPKDSQTLEFLVQETSGQFELRQVRLY